VGGLMGGNKGEVGGGPSELRCGAGRTSLWWGIKSAGKDVVFGKDKVQYVGYFVMYMPRCIPIAMPSLYST
jgi:hypothetical protein